MPLDNVEFPEIRFTSETALYKFVGQIDPRLIQIVGILAHRRGDTYIGLENDRIQREWDKVEEALGRAKNKVPKLQQEKRELLCELQDAHKALSHKSEQIDKWKEKAKKFSNVLEDVADVLHENRILWLERNAFKEKLKAIYDDKWNIHIAKTWLKTQSKKR